MQNFYLLGEDGIGLAVFKIELLIFYECTFVLLFNKIFNIEFFAIRQNKIEFSFVEISSFFIR